MPNTGLFYLFDVRVAGGQASSDADAKVLSVHAECLSCRHVANATSPPSLVNIPGGG